MKKFLSAFAIIAAVILVASSAFAAPTLSTSNTFMAAELVPR